MFWGLSFTLGIKQESAIYLNNSIDETEKYSVSYHAKKKEDRVLLANYFSHKVKNRLKKTVFKKRTALKDLAYILDFAEKPKIKFDDIFTKPILELHNNFSKIHSIDSGTFENVRIASDVVKGPMRKRNNCGGSFIPIVTIAPNYPRKASIAKIEGWVKVEFNITGKGMVVNPRVIQARPIGVFEEEALKAILRFKFDCKSSLDESKRIQALAVQTIEFKLAKD